MKQAENSRWDNRTDKEDGMGREIAAIIAGALMPTMDTTIVSIGITSLMEVFHVNEVAIQWVSTAYLLALAVAIPAVGWAEERFGARRCWMAGLILFLIGSALCAVSPGLAALVAFRVLQGFGAGALITLLTAMPAEIARNRGILEIGGIMSTVMLPLSVGPIMGPVLGGIVLSIASWHWLFLINIPVGIAAVVFAARWLGPEADGVRTQSHRYFDLPGFLLVAGGISFLLLGMTAISQGESLLRSDVAVPLLLGILLLVLFVLLPSTRDPWRAIIDIRLFRYRSVTVASFAMFFAGGTFYAAQFLFPVFWQSTMQTTALDAALMLIPQGIGALLTRTAAGRLTDQYGGHVVATGGFLASAVTTALFPFCGSGSIVLYGILFIRGLAIGMLIVPITTSAFVGLPDKDVSRATVIIRVFQQVGASFGTAVVASAASVAAQQVSGTAAETAMGYLPAFLVLVAITAAGAAASFAFPGKRRGKLDAGRKKKQRTGE